MIYYSIYKSSVGEILIASTDKGICKISLQTEDAGDFFKYIGSMGHYYQDTSKNIKYMNQLDEYFSGSLKEFLIDLDLRGTDFQLSVWKELKKIPYGQVRTYGDIARALSTAPRAVGQANKNNPIPIVIPCHRVVSSTGIGGYSGQMEGKNIGIKEYLLKLEGFDCSKFSKP